MAPNTATGRFTLELPVDLLAECDALCKANQATRTTFIRDALKQALDDSKRVLPEEMLHISTTINPDGHEIDLPRPTDRSLRRCESFFFSHSLGSIRKPMNSIDLPLISHYDAFMNYQNDEHNLCIDHAFSCYKLVEVINNIPVVAEVAFGGMPYGEGKNRESSRPDEQLIQKHGLTWLAKDAWSWHNIDEISGEPATTLHLCYREGREEMISSHWGDSLARFIIKSGYYLHDAPIRDMLDSAATNVSMTYDEALECVDMFSYARGRDTALRIVQAWHNSLKVVN